MPLTQVNFGLTTLLEKPPLQKFTAAVNLIKDARNIKVTFVLTLIEVKIQS